MIIQFATRPIIRKLYNVFLGLIISIASPKAIMLSKVKSKYYFKNKNSCKIVAPGKSISKQKPLNINYNESDFFGLNYFIECTHIPEWEYCNTFIIEPHSIGARYIDAVKSAIDLKNEINIIIKGISSPKKIITTITFIKKLSKIDGVTVFFSLDKYTSDYPSKKFSDLLVENTDQIVSGGKSLQWCLSLAYVMDYPSIILQGFDFTKEYAYQKDEKIDVLPPNTWVNDEYLKNKIIIEIEQINYNLSKINRKIYQFQCDGPLSSHLEDYSK